MKKTVVNILIIAAIVAGTWFAKGEISPTVINNTVTDTVYVDKPYKVTKIKEVEKPVTVTKYKTKYDTVESVKVVKDTIYVDTNLDTYLYNTRFLTNHPSVPKFLGLTHQNKNVELTYLTTNGNTQSKTWNVGYLGYEIGLNDGNPSLKTLDSEKQQLQFSHNINAGVEGGFKYWSPYAEYNVEVSFFEFPLTGKAHISRKPYISLGVKYKFE